MRKAGSTYELGRAAFSKGTLRKATNDERLLIALENLTGEGVDLRELKDKEISEWKRGWDDAKKETLIPIVEEVAEPVASKKKKKKSTKKT